MQDSNFHSKNQAADATLLGELYVVATAIGTIEDLSLRARRILSEVDLILAEDTRRAGRLLSELGIKCRLLSFYDHNERSRTDELIVQLKAGSKMALISDAGTPTISDPGYRIVRACAQAGIKVVPVPGPCSAIAAISVSGLATDRFMFEGFLPPKGKKRADRLAQILINPWTSIVLESTHKIVKLVEEISMRDPERELVIARELTKTFEEILRGTAEELVKAVHRSGGLKGEMVVIISGQGKHKDYTHAK